MALDLASQVTVPIVLPGVSHVMLPGCGCRNQILPDSFGISAQTRFIFDDKNRSSRMFHEDRDDAGLHRRGVKEVPNAVGDILDVRMAFHRDREVMSKDGHRIVSLVYERERRNCCSDRDNVPPRAALRMESKLPKAVNCRTALTTLVRTRPCRFNESR